jgi:hypothetical protein
MAIGGELMNAVFQLTADARGRLKNKQPLEKGDADLLLQAPTSIRAIAMFAQTGSQLNADGLLIPQLMEKIKEGGE